MDVKELAATIIAMIESVDDPTELTQMERNILDLCRRRVN